MSVQPAVPGTVQRIGEEAKPYECVRGNYKYSLVIEQQPIRARMCGFGDKDRRPITPPPCIRIVITDITTGQEVPATSVDASFFLLSVDLWDENAQSEKNVVRASSSSPAQSISTATTTSFPPQIERPVYAPPGLPMYPSYAMPGAPPQYSPYAQGQSLPSMYPGNGPAGYYPPAPGYPPQYSASPAPASPAFPQPYGQSAPGYAVSGATGNTNMYTRNLIGSLTVNAFPLRDTEEKDGHWFILQDLSVRTEGTFRLKMSFIDVGTHRDPISKDSHNTLETKNDVPILAYVFSQPFQVFSAKKFPGVIESTPLSKKFAHQGIKIPIRKDGKEGEKTKDEEGDD